jgi:hypothetical protein
VLEWDFNQEHKQLGAEFQWRRNTDRSCGQHYSEKLKDALLLKEYLLKMPDVGEERVFERLPGR